MGKYSYYRREYSIPYEPKKKYTMPPCTQDCPDRTFDCKWNCDAYVEWEKLHKKERLSKDYTINTTAQFRF